VPPTSPSTADVPTSSPISTAGAAPIELVNVTQLFGRFAALREVSTTFESGKLCAIFGGNGAGKSTLLRIIAGLARPTRGGVKIFGSPDLRGVTAQLGYMAHSALLYEDLSAMENLRYFAGLYGLNATAAEQASVAAIEKVGLDPRLARRVGDYSQGMRQRLSLARAVLHDPKILLLDEPFSNVDVTSARNMARLVGSLRDEGRTVLMITHQAGAIEEVTDESIFLADGKILGRGPGISAARWAEARPA